ncbi:MAG TPA: NAD(P)-dependent oxidoreductase [Candidatus Hydrogenedentes bacterium]|nr:NAD(P)-dependent oxidoreductase [Candidatus Hydrogenedentota bacterium]HPG70324.1 NAD(P)-dependent oxidoreductase [Candidatus Hydrogenedentota bacterium]
MKVLVTGASGNVGRVVVRELAEKGHDVTGFDLRPVELDGARFVEGSVTDPDAVAKAVEGMDAIVHLAAIPCYRPEIPVADFMQVNVVGTSNVLDAAGRHGVQRVAMASSDSSLGFVFSFNRFSPEYFPIDEAHPRRPQDPYGLSKLLGEELCKSASRRYGFRTIALRFCWVWFEDTYGQHDAILAGDPAVLAKTMWGYVDVRDAAQACRLAVESADPTPHDAFFITAEDTYSKTPSLELIRAHYPEVRRVSEAFLDDPFRSIFDITKARTFLGYRPQYSWRKV